MWQHVPDVMKRYKFPKPGEFDEFNGFDGVCWGWPKECTMSNSKAFQIFWTLYKKRCLTLAQTNVVSKALAFAYELKGGEPLGNWQGVKQVRAQIVVSKLADAKGRVIPVNIPSVEQLAGSFNKGWTSESTMTLIEHTSGVICANDCFLNGLRSNEDVDRLKKSRDVTLDAANGWMRTGFHGGRAKLCGTKKGTRPWSLYTVCFCEGGQHQSPPASFAMKPDGNPRDPAAVTWDTRCPLAAVELQRQLTEEPRRYPKWSANPRLARFMKVHNIADPVECAIDWMVEQGFCPANLRFDHNSGRKAFARWTRKAGVEYRDVFEVVGDLQEVWRKNYDPDLPLSTYEKRQQSRDPNACTAALRAFAKRILKRGGRFMPRMSRHERLMYTQIKLQYGEEAAQKALWGDGDEW